MHPIYLDNASTSFPKPACVPDAVYRYMTACGSNVSRGGYRSAYSAEELVFETRERLCALFHGGDARCVVFTPNITTSLNLLLKGFLRPGDHVLVSSMEHNAVMRPLRQLEAAGVTFDRVPCNPDGTLRLSEAEALVRENTKLFVCLHASNVCGTLLPIKEIGTFCKRHQIRFFLDSAQTAGVFPIDMQTCHIDAVAFTGHKGLRGPQGTGGIVLREELAQELGLPFLNSSDALKGGDGYAKPDYVIGDGLHLSQAALEELLFYTRTHAYEAEDRRPVAVKAPERKAPPAWQGVVAASGGAQAS